jgi:hypothetical protein
MEMPTISPRMRREANNLAEQVRIISNNGDDIIKYLFDVLGDGEEQTGYRLQAAQMLLNRGYGREQVEINVTNEGDSELRRYSLEELLSIERAISSIEATGVVVEEVPMLEEAHNG